MSLTSTGSSDQLRDELESRAHQLRPASHVMSPEVLGSSRLTRYSFSRSMLRRAITDGWSTTKVRVDVNEAGEGEAIYRVETPGHLFHFVAFTTTLDESLHTDRVVAGAWEITAGLVEGEIDDDFLTLLRREIPKQEEGRLTPDVLVLTRGNRSVRFFDYLVDTLAAGDQPDPDHVADAGYIMRSTAFYGNGKYGMRSFEGYPAGHPLRVPYRAQFVAAWCYRELSYDVVESCARQKGGAAAVGFNDEWSRYFGLGNATGLGLVPYAFNHPRVINTWAAIREIALADVRATAGTDAQCSQLDGWISKARKHYAEGTDDDCTPFLNTKALAPIVELIADAFDRVRDEPYPFDALYRWAADRQSEAASSAASSAANSAANSAAQRGAPTAHSELTELVVSLLVELHEGDDDLFDELLIADERSSFDPALSVSEALQLIAERFPWLDDLGLDVESADAFWWVISDNTEEPRRALRERLDPNHRDVAIDIALRMWRLRAALEAVAAAPAGSSETGSSKTGSLKTGSSKTGSSKTLHAFLSELPEHRLAIERLHASDTMYGEVHDNVCAQDYLPLLIQRFQLAMYGMDNFKPKSTDWLRVTLFQGAPRVGELTTESTDDWVFPARPSTQPSHQGSQQRKTDAAT